MDADAAAAAAAARRQQARHSLDDDVSSGDASGGGYADEDDWRQRLRDEMSDDEAGGIGYARCVRGAWPAAHTVAASSTPRPDPVHPISAAGLPLAQPPPPAPLPWYRYRPGAADDTFVWPQGLGDGDDDAWADRIWESMRRARRAADAAAARAAGFKGAAAARAEAAEARARRAAAAAAEGARILEEERAKEANWREAMLRQVAEVSPARLRARLAWMPNQRRSHHQSDLFKPDSQLLRPLESALPYTRAGGPAGAPARV